MGTNAKDIQWHMIGHVQTNKVKYMAPICELGSWSRQFQIIKRDQQTGGQNDRVIDCLQAMILLKRKRNLVLIRRN
jgi:uncharacterized pyridoxal phosphate-containing UPF0001 family protein